MKNKPILTEIETELPAMPTLRDLRRAKGWSQQNLADMLDVDQPTISEVERTGKGIGLEKWLMVSTIFDIDLRNISR